MTKSFHTAAVLLGLLAAVLGIAWATDEYVHAQIQEDLRPVAEIFANVVRQQQAIMEDVKKNNDHRVRADERARLKRDGCTPLTPEGDSK